MRLVPVHMQHEVNRQLDLMLQHNSIHTSAIPWAGAIVLVRKMDGTRRFCIEYRRLTDMTVKDAYPLPRIDGSLDQLAGSRWFSSLDLSAGRSRTRGQTKDSLHNKARLFEFNVMPFGLCNTLANMSNIF